MDEITIFKCAYTQVCTADFYHTGHQYLYVPIRYVGGQSGRGRVGDNDALDLGFYRCDGKINLAITDEADL